MQLYDVWTKTGYQYGYIMLAESPEHALQRVKGLGYDIADAVVTEHDPKAVVRVNPLRPVDVRPVCTSSRQTDSDSV